MSSIQFRPDIQGLRAIAVLAVIVFHLNPAWLPGGFVGVDIFLVISGYLIAGILLKKKARPEYRLVDTLNYFYISRFKRIIPAYSVTLIMVSLLAALLFLPADFSIYKEGLNKAVLFNSNNYFAQFGDYFAPANYEQPLLHTWSLAVEIQFYLVAPFMFLLVPKRLLRWLLPIAIVLLISYAEYRLQQGIEQATYYSFLARLPAFFLGGWVALLTVEGNCKMEGGRQSVWLSCFALVLIAFALIIPKPTGHFPGIAGLVPVTAAALLMWLDGSNRIAAFLSTKTIVWVGALSYSLYLWHWPVLAFMRYYTGAEILDWQFSFAFIGLTLVLAIASYYWIETPLRQMRSKMQLVGYACLVLITLGAGAGIKKINAYFTPELLPIEYKRYADPSIICHGQIIGECLKGDTTSEREILVLGDSHAAMLNNFFDYIGKVLNVKFRVITASSCMTFHGFDYERIPEWAQDLFLSQIRAAEKFVEKSNAIILAGMWSYQLSFDTFERSFIDYLNSLNVKKVYILPQVPLLNTDIQRVERFNYLGLNAVVYKDSTYRLYNDFMGLISERYSNVELVHLKYDEEWFYKLSYIYSDESHLNELGSIEYAMINVNVLGALLGDD